MKRYLKVFGKRIKKLFNISSGITNKKIFIAVIFICLVLFGVSYLTESSFKPVRVLANYTVVPMKTGLNRIGTFLGDSTGSLATIDELQQENEQLKAQIQLLKDENARLLQDDAELKRLQDLYALEEAYGNYHKVAARIISRESSNWFNKFTIDKGSIDGIEENMNVIANGGLVGIVTETGPNYATVRSIIDDNSNVSAMTLSTNDICYVKGDITQINEGTVKFEDMQNNSNEIYKGETIVTSNISSRFLPGIVIGYVSGIKVDPNNLTRSGVLVPAVDFAHLQEVLIITDLKKDIVSLKDSNNQDNTSHYSLDDPEDNSDQADNMDSSDNSADNSSENNQ